MYRYINGKVVEKGFDYVVIDVGGIGYKLNCSFVTISSVTVGEVEKLFTIMVVREDDISLCGFYEDDERIFFEYLVSVSGIGQKTALAMISKSNYRDIAKNIISANENALSKLPGIGKKTAQRLIVELKDKLEKNFILGDFEDDGHDVPITADIRDSEVYGALISLGFNHSEIVKMLHNIDVNAITLEEAIALALRNS